MSLPRILLIGKNGQVGRELRRALAPMAALECVDFPEIDLASADSIRHWVRTTRPRVVINAAAYTAVDRAETEPELAMKINGVAPGILAQESRGVGALLVHYSTDYVFDGASTAPYVETDAPNPLNVYGRSKLAGDLAVQAVGGAHLIFRLCWVYGVRGQNFLLTILRLVRRRERLRVVNDQLGAPTWCRLIAQATSLALRQVAAQPDPGAFAGLYHLAASGLASWHAFAEQIVQLMTPAAETRIEVRAISTAEYPTPAKRPYNSAMCCDKLERAFGLRLPPWDECLRMALENTTL